MARYGLVIDIRKCCGCFDCQLACKDEHCGNEYPGYSVPQPMSGHFWMKVSEKETGTYPKVKVSFTPLTCMHCKDAPCIQVAKNGAVYRRPDGIVMIDPVKARGQKEIVSACPYRVIYWNEEQNVPQKCTFCAHLLDQGWKEPRCVELCPTGALVFGDLDDPKSDITKLIAAEQIEKLHPEFGLEGNVSYIGLPKKFIAGTVIYGDVVECAKGVIVTISSNGKTQQTETDGFGDFEFDGLQDNCAYNVKIEAKDYKPVSIDVKTVKDVNVGTIQLERR